MTITNLGNHGLDVTYVKAASPKILRNSCRVGSDTEWDLTSGKDVSEPGERCGDANLAELARGRDDHDGASPGVMARQARGELRRQGTSCIVAAILGPPRSGRGAAEIRK